MSDLTQGNFGSSATETAQQRFDRILGQLAAGERDFGSVRRGLGRTTTPGAAFNDQQILASGDRAAIERRLRDVFVGAGLGDLAATQPKVETPARDFATEVRRLYPFIPAALVPVFAEAWQETGDAAQALATIRSDSRYDQLFPGNRRPDGSVRLDEAEYLSVQEGYSRRVREYSPHLVDLLLTPERRRRLIEGDVSPEEFGSKIDRMYVDVMSRSDGIRQFYAQSFAAGDLSDLALFASAVDGATTDGLTRSPMVFERNIRTAQIGGTASDYGFDIARQEAERLGSFGLDVAGAQQLYARAASEVPTLNQLLGRFNDPDDELTAEEYADALVIRDPDQLRTIGRLFGRATSEFSSRGLFRSDESGALTGLRQR